MTDRFSFGDTVAVHATPETRAAQIVGKIGRVYGHTTPSVTCVPAIGGLGGDCAVYVFFEDLGESFWLTEDLLEFIDHGSGTRVAIVGAEKELVRRADGSWSEVHVAKSLTRPKALLRLIAKDCRRRWMWIISLRNRI